MNESSRPAGYRRPPEHTRFQKGQSGNPGGKPGPKKRLKREFDAALKGAMDGNRWELRDARPVRGIEALARKIALDALDGRSSAQKVVLAMLENEDGGGAVLRQAQDEVLRHDQGEVLRQDQDQVLRPAFGETDGQAQGEVLRQAQDEVLRQAQDEEQEEDDDDDDDDDDEDEDELGEEDRFVYEDEDARQALGDRYDEFKARFEYAMNEGNLDDLTDLAVDFGYAQFSASGNFSGTLKKNGAPDCAPLESGEGGPNR